MSDRERNVKRPRMQKAKPIRQKLTALPRIPPVLEDFLREAKEALAAVTADFDRQPLKWGLRPDEEFEKYAQPYKDRVESAEDRISDYLNHPENHLTSTLACIALEEFKDITLSEHQSRLGRRAKSSELPSEDGCNWDGQRIAEAARKRGYAGSSDKNSIINELSKQSGKSEATVRRAIKAHGLSRQNGKRKAIE